MIFSLPMGLLNCSSVVGPRPFEHHLALAVVLFALPAGLVEPLVSLGLFALVPRLDEWDPAKDRPRGSRLKFLQPRLGELRRNMLKIQCRLNRILPQRLERWVPRFPQARSQQAYQLPHLAPQSVIRGYRFILAHSPLPPCHCVTCTRYRPKHTVCAGLANWPPGGRSGPPARTGSSVKTEASSVP